MTMIGNLDPVTLDKLHEYSLQESATTSFPIDSHHPLANSGGQSPDLFAQLQPKMRLNPRLKLPLVLVAIVIGSAVVARVIRNSRSIDRRNRAPGLHDRVYPNVLGSAVAGTAGGA